MTKRHRTFHFLSLLVIAVPGGATAQPQRSMHGGTWREVGRFEDAPGKVLSLPTQITRCGARVIVLDLGEPRIVAFDLAGKPAWQFGSKKPGSDELKEPREIVCDALGRLWILDSGLGRIDVLSPLGALERTISVNPRSRALAVLSNGRRFALMTWNSKELYELFDENGLALNAPAAPVELETLSVLQREARQVATADNTIVTIFRWSSIVLCTDSIGGSVFRSPGIETVSFASQRAYPMGGRGSPTMVRIVANAVGGSQQIVVSKSSIYIRFQGRTNAKGRILDRYDVHNGRYLGSLSLPFLPVDFTFDGTDAYVIVRDPVPALVHLKWSGSFE